MNFSKQTEEMLDELDRIAMLPHRWHEEKILDNLKKFYALYGMEFPQILVKCVDIFDERLKSIFEWQAGQARQARQARQAGQAWQERQARQAWQAWQARQARQARQAWQARQARQARQVWQAGQERQARQAWQAIEYAIDYLEPEALVLTLEYSATHDINDNDHKFMSGQRLLLAAKEAGLGFFVDDEHGTLYLVPCAQVRLNKQNQHHSDRLPAISWKDGAQFYYINGVHFPEELFKKITSPEVTAKDILSIQDIDQRTQAMRFLSADDMVKELHGELLDEYQKLTINGEVVDYKLYRFPKGDVFTEDAYYCLFDCPSTRKKHMEGMEVSATVPQAMAWAEDITEEEWKLRVPLLHEV